MWQAINDEFTRTDPTSQLLAFRSFFDMKMKPGETPANFSHRFMGNYKGLLVNGMEFSERIARAFFLVIVPKEYDVYGTMVFGKDESLE